MADEEKPAPDSFVKSARNIVSSLILAGLIGIGAMVMNGNTQIAVMAKSLEGLGNSIEDLKKDRYTGSAAAADFRLRDIQLTQNATMLADHDKRIRDLESRRK